MKTFFQWAEENKVSLPIEAPKKQKTTAENTRRTGYSHNYPDAYVRSQYPHKYFNPYKGTADLDDQNKPRSGGKNTAAN